VGGYAARAPQDSLRLRRRFGGVGRLLNFTVRSRFLWRSANLKQREFGRPSVASWSAAGRRPISGRSWTSAFAFRARVWNSLKAGRSGAALLERDKNNRSRRPRRSERGAGGEASGSAGFRSGTLMRQRRKLRQSKNSSPWFTRTDMPASLAEPTPNHRLERTVTAGSWRATSALRHFALVSRRTRLRTAAQAHR